MTTFKITGTAAVDIDVKDARCALWLFQHQSLLNTVLDFEVEDMDTGEKAAWSGTRDDLRAVAVKPPGA